MRALWPHQVEALDTLRQTIGQGVRRIALSAPTGSGKTLLSAAIIEGAQRKSKRVAFVVSSIGLVDQTIEALYAEGIRDIGVIQANHAQTDWSKPVQVASIQTINSRGVFPQADIVIIDEMHVLHEAHKRWLVHPEWQNVPFIGLSATPYTRGLGKYFKTLIVVSTTAEMIAKGVLCPFRVFATGHPDLAGVSTVAGDYHEGELSQAMQGGTLTADIVRTWQEKWGQDKTLCFGVDRAHAKAVQERFEHAGVTCGYQDAHTPSDERREIKRKFHNGEYRVVSNIATLTTGTDWDVRCLVLGRPTKSLALYQQIIGRALRTAPDKQTALILDHSDTTQRLGFVTDIHFDKLDDGTPAAKQAKPERKAALPKECKQCSALVPAGTKICPACGTERKRETDVIERDGELIEVTAGERRAKKVQHTAADKALFFAQLKAIANERQHSPGWVAHKFRSKFDVWPRGLDGVQPMQPTPEVLSWVKSQNIRWAKSRKREDAQHV